jgi:biopolymer transport protein ExbD
MAELRSRLTCTRSSRSRRSSGSAATPVPYEKIVALMDELKKANLLKFTFDTQAASK